MRKERGKRKEKGEGEKEEEGERRKGTGGGGRNLEALYHRSSVTVPLTLHC